LINLRLKLDSFFHSFFTSSIVDLFLASFSSILKIHTDDFFLFQKIVNYPPSKLSNSVNSDGSIGVCLYTISPILNGVFVVIISYKMIPSDLKITKLSYIQSSKVLNHLLLLPNVTWKTIIFFINSLWCHVMECASTFRNKFR
jgi:hypothetical protein